jgi:DNA ligase 1
VFKLFVLVFLFLADINALTLQKALIYKDQNISGWVMSEKFDGIRAYWDGKNLLTRQGRIFHPPASFIKNFPSFELDGELWSKRGDFENIQSIVLDESPEVKWSQIKYKIFEVPHAKGDFLARLQKAQDFISKNNLAHVQIIEQKVCNTKEELDEFLKRVIAKGGEGVIIKDGSKEYFEGRSSSILKMKLAQDMEGKVIGYKDGSGKFKGMMGSLHVELDDGVKFYIGSGFSDEQRKNPPSLGSMVTFKYFGFTKYKKPKFASFMRVRKN